MVMTDRGIDNLRIAIVLCAAKEYVAKSKTLVRVKARKPDDTERIKGLDTDIKGIERFFLSEWYEFLCDIEGNVLIENLQTLVADPAYRIGNHERGGLLSFEEFIIRFK